MAVETLLIGLLLAVLWSEVTDLSPGGLVVPGYLALAFDQPLRIAATLGAALAAWAVYRLLARRLILFGRRRFVLTVLLGAVAAQAWAVLLPALVPDPAGLRVVGLIVPGLLASCLTRQRIAPTLASLAAVSTLTFAAAALVDLL